MTEGGYGSLPSGGRGRLKARLWKWCELVEWARRGRVSSDSRCRRSLCRWRCCRCVLLVCCFLWRAKGGMYLRRFAARCGDGLRREEFCEACNRLFCGELIFDDAAASLAFSLYLINRSPIFARRRAMGMRLTRISIRVFSP